MDMNQVVQFINAVGFPIVACVFMAVNNMKQTVNHRQEIDKLSDALKNNTLVMQRLIDKLDGVINDDGSER